MKEEEKCNKRMKVGEKCSKRRNKEKRKKITWEFSGYDKLGKTVAVSMVVEVYTQRIHRFGQVAHENFNGDNRVPPGKATGYALLPHESIMHTSARISLKLAVWNARQKRKKESTQTAVKRTNAGPMTPRNRTFFLPPFLFFSALFSLSSFSLSCSYCCRYCFLLFLRQERKWDWKKENSRWNTTECLNMRILFFW